jgi:hypothetical protein
MAEENAVLQYKGRPLMRKDNLIYYGSMADSHIVMLQILESKKVGTEDVVAYVSAVKLQGARSLRYQSCGWRCHTMLSLGRKGLRTLALDLKHKIRG